MIETKKLNVGDVLKISHLANMSLSIYYIVMKKEPDYIVLSQRRKLRLSVKHEILRIPHENLQRVLDEKKLFGILLTPLKQRYNALYISLFYGIEFKA
jgi:hypothetical protein